MYNPLPIIGTILYYIILRYNKYTKRQFIHDINVKSCKNVDK